MQDSESGSRGVDGAGNDAHAVTLASTVVVSPHQVSTSLGDEAVILGADAGQYFGLNEVGARIWELVQAPVQVRDLCATVCAEYEVTSDQCERDVLELLSDLRAKGLLDVRAEPSAT
ncbi:MAG: hypothetical protein RLZZ450_1575 [Pseudomonadota bacterium]|jgi:Coenzyme PQQ synthesis protein D (PqqD)